MGAWSVTAFGNDEAMDWMFDLQEEGIPLIKETLDNVLDDDDYIDLLFSDSAIAAAEVIAGALGSPGANLPKEVSSWLKRAKYRPTSGEVNLALAAIRKVRADSETKDLWEESDKYGEWQSAMDDLEARLQKHL